MKFKFFDRIKNSINMKILLVTIVSLIVFMFAIATINYNSLNHMKQQALDITDSELNDLVEEYYDNYINSVNVHISNQMTSIFDELHILSNILQTFFSNRSNMDGLVAAMDESPYFKDNLKEYSNYMQNDASEPSVVAVASYLYDGGVITPKAVKLIEDTRILDLILPAFIDQGVSKVQIYFQGGQNKEIFRLAPWSNLGEDVLAVYPDLFNAPIWETFNPGLAGQWRELIQSGQRDINDLLRVTPPVQDGLSGDIVLTFSQPITNEARTEFEGTISYDVSIGNITSMVEDIEISESGFAFITQANGNVFSVNEKGLKTMGFLNDSDSTVDSEEGFNRLERPLQNSKFEAIQNLQMNTGDQLKIETIVIDGVEYMFASKALYAYQSWTPDTSFFDEAWQIGFLVPRDEVYSMYYAIQSDIENEVSKLNVNTLIITFILGLVILFFIYKFNTMVTKELVALSHVADAVKRKDYDVEIPVNTTDEVGVLASAFKGMVVEVKSSFEKLEQHNELLQAEIDERIARDRIIDYLENFDSSTDLPNKKALLNILKEMKTVKEHFVSLVVIGLDEFRKVNEAYSWNFGDKLIVSIADRLKKTLPNECILFKLSGDEFAFVLRDSKLKNLISVVEEVSDSFKKPFKVKEYEVMISASIGISSFPFDTEEPTELFKYATNAMIHTKEVNRGKYEFYSSEMNDSARMRMTMLNELRNAVDYDEFELYYQPIVSVVDKKVTGMEALLRWHNKTLGSVSPGVFIPLAEKTDLMIKIGEWVLKHALLETKKMHDMGHDLQVAVNVSVMQFLDANFVANLSDIISETQIDASKVTIEITEGLFIKDVDSILRVLNDIRAMGISISVDDFGTGYSSLSYIKDLPLSKLKIDRSFISAIDEDMSQKLVSAIIGLAHNLNLSVVAEGIENHEQLSYIENKKCEEFQGYLCSKPLAFDDFIEYIKRPTSL